MIQTVDSDVVVLSFGYAKLVKDAVVETFLWYFDQKRHIFMCLITLVVLGATYAEGYIISTRLPDAMQHPVFISLVRLSSGKYGWSNTATSMEVSLGYSYVMVINHPNDIDIIAKYIYKCYGLDTFSCTLF